MCVCKTSFVFRLITRSKMKTGLIAFHLAYVQVVSMPFMEAVAFQHPPLDVLQTLSSVIYLGAKGKKKVLLVRETPQE